MLLSAVSVLVVAQSSSEIPEGLMNNLVFRLKIYSQLLAKANAKALNKQFPTARTDLTKTCNQAYQGK